MSWKCIYISNISWVSVYNTYFLILNIYNVINEFYYANKMQHKFLFITPKYVGKWNMEKCSCKLLFDILIWSPWYSITVISFFYTILTFLLFQLYHFSILWLNIVFHSLLMIDHRFSIGLISGKVMNNPITIFEYLDK